MKKWVYSRLNIGIFAGSGTTLGDTIRTKKIMEFLRERGYGVVNLNNMETPVNKVHSHSVLLKLAKWVFTSIPFFDHINLLRLSRNLEKKIQRENIDILQCETTIPAYIGARALALAVRQKKIPLVFDMHGLTAEQALMEGKPKHLVDFVRKIQFDALRLSNHIFVVSDLHKKYLQSRGVPPEKMTVVPNAAEIRPKFAKMSEPVNVVFGGIFAYWENIQTYVKASTFNKDDQINFYLAGDGPLRGSLFSLIKRLGSPIRYVGRLSPNEALGFFDKCHIGILTSSKDIARQIACPIKFFDYMSCGLAVVSEDVGWWSQLITNKSFAV